MSEPRVPAESEVSWQQLLQSGALEALLAQNPDLCKQLEEAIAQQDEEAGTSQGTEVTLDLRRDKKEKQSSVSTTPLGQFGDYELLEEIGRGGMGVVYRARQRNPDRVVALKMILSGEFANATDLRRFQAEANAAAKLNHSHIVPIYEVNVRDGRHYFSMALVEGPTLDHVIKMRPLDAETAAEIVRKIALAAAYAHEQGIIHRDLKPANILLDNRGEPKIADFGLAKWGEGDGTNERTGDIVGTPSYMAPEQAAGRVNELTAAADVYSLGAILYACLTGRPPFQAESKLDTILAVLESEATLPRQINRQTPRELEWIVLRCLEKRPENRYHSAAALAEDLERFLLGEPVEARRTGWWPQLRRWARRQPSLVSHLTVIAVMTTVHQILHWFVLGGSKVYLWNMTLLFAAWAIGSVFFQWLLDRPSRAEVARYCWAATDALLLTTALFLTGPPLDGLLIGYPLLVVAAGLFFRVRLVIFMLAACLVGFGVLSYQLGSKPIYPPIYFALGLTALGLMVAYQVHRIRVLSRYYHKDPAAA
jgi:serine/threonine-protein kinase